MASTFGTLTYQKNGSGSPATPIPLFMLAAFSLEVSGEVATCELAHEGHEIIRSLVIAHPVNMPMDGKIHFIIVECEFLQHSNILVTIPLHFQGLG